MSRKPPNIDPHDLDEVDKIRAFDAAITKRTAFGSREVAPHAAIADVSRGQADAAKTLAGKVVRKWVGRDRAGVDRLVDRLTDMDYDVHEELWPGVVAAQLEFVDLLVARADYETRLMRCECGSPHDEIGDLQEAGDSLVGDVDALRSGCLARELRQVDREAEILSLDPTVVGRAVMRVDGIEDGVDPHEVPKDAAREERRSLIEAYLGLSAFCEAFLSEGRDAASAIW